LVDRESEQHEPRAETAAPTREVRHEYTLNWVPLLKHLGTSILVSTYQAGKLVAVSAAGDALDLSYHNFERAMGVAVSPDRLAVGTRAAVWFLRNAPELAPRIEPAGQHDACFLARFARFTGEIQGHELAWSGDELWVVNTLFSCLSTLDDRHSFVPRWRPRFITALAAEDRCHLNGLALADGRPKYVTAMAESDSPQGWRPTKATSGCLIDVVSGETIIRGLAMPHSPRVHDGRVWLLDSGRGQLVVADLDRGTTETVAELPGYTRGLALLGTWAFVGLSRIRETATFGGLPIAEKRDTLRCGVAVVDLATGRQAALLEFHSGIEEIFDVQVLPGIRSPVLSGPHPELDDRPMIWLVPPPTSSTSIPRNPGS
jgi:uncharacterized protein (TIGR03032 family)